MQHEGEIFLERFSPKSDDAVVDGTAHWSRRIRPGAPMNFFARRRTALWPDAIGPHILLSTRMPMRACRGAEGVFRAFLVHFGVLMASPRVTLASLSIAMAISRAGPRDAEAIASMAAHGENASSLPRPLRWHA